jgi:hypothetical protein
MRGEDDNTLSGFRGPDVTHVSQLDAGRAER